MPRRLTPSDLPPAPRDLREGLAGVLQRLPREKHPRSPRAEAAHTLRGRHLRWGLRALALICLAGIIFCGIETASVYQRVQAVQRDLSELGSLHLGSLQPAAVAQVGPLAARTHGDIDALRAALQPWLWISPLARWLPAYGGDAFYADALLHTASDFASASSQAHDALMPVWTAINHDGEVNGNELTRLLIDTQPSLRVAQSSLASAFVERGGIQAESLSPAMRARVARLDAYMSALDQSIALGLAVPGLLGISGPKTYLVLIENEDELRASGGFVTAVGKAVIADGQLVSLNIVDAYSVDDPNAAYPAAPWQLQEFMNIPIIVFRDASWFTDFPTAVRWARYLYGFSDRAHLDGVIAIDQAFIARLLTVSGPVDVPEIGQTVTADNLQAVMRAQKIPPPADERDPDWHRKKFMNPIAAAVLGRFTSNSGISWVSLLGTIMGQLDQRHMQVQLDDPVLARLLAQRGWDGAVRTNGGDYLMVVDTNVGYNKTNAVVQPAISYDVNLQDLGAPTSSLFMSYTNRAAEPSPDCNQYPSIAGDPPGERWYAIDRCYYDYLRIYLPAGAAYVRGTPQTVAPEDMAMLDEAIPARVDLLDDDVAGLQGFGTLLVAPLSSTTQTSFEFTLPVEVVQSAPGSGARHYRLKIQKQAGTRSIPVTLRLHLPPRSQVQSANREFLQSGADLLFTLQLSTDLFIDVEFSP